MKRITFALMLGGAMLAGDRAMAQSTSTYTQSLLNAIANNNSIAGFSSDRIQRRLVNSAVPQQYFTPVNYSNFFNSTRAGGQRSKPFSNLSNPSSVTPYLALSEPFSSSAHSYYTQVRPQLEQQRINQQMAQRNMRMQQQLSSLAAQPPFNPTGNQTMAPTGHAAVYMNFGGYYPSGGPQQQQRR